MAGHLTFSPLAQLVDLLRGAGMRADADPASLNVPGAWVTVEAIRPLTVGGNLQLGCVVYLIVGDTDHQRALEQLADLYNKMATVLTPDGDVTPQGVLMPDSSNPLPALRVPVNLLTNTD